MATRPKLIRSWSLCKGDVKSWKRMGKAEQFLNFSEPCKQATSAQSFISSLTPSALDFLWLDAIFSVQCRNISKTRMLHMRLSERSLLYDPTQLDLCFPPWSLMRSRLGFVTPLAGHNCSTRSLWLLPGCYRQGLLTRGSRGLCKVFWPLWSLLQGMFPP